MFDRESVLRVISDLHKDVYGFRGSKRWSELPDWRLEAEWNFLNEQLVVVMAQEAREKLEAQRVWEAHIANLVTIGAGCRSTAIRWDMDSHKVGDDVGYYCYLTGLDYALEDQIRRDLR